MGRLNIRPDDILTYWLDQVGPAGWYNGDLSLDDDIRTRFQTTWEHSQTGGCGLWLTNPSGALAFAILTDQFPRNMFRGDGRAFASDGAARAAAKVAIDREWDMQISEPARHFLYMPLMHSENVMDQDRAVRLIHSRLPQTGGDTILHARVHRSIVRKYGRFPYRNAALGRSSSAVEQGFLDDGGYGAAFRAFQADQAD